MGISDHNQDKNKIEGQLSVPGKSPPKGLSRLSTITRVMAIITIITPMIQNIAQAAEDLDATDSPPASPASTGPSSQSRTAHRSLTNPRAHKSTSMNSSTSPATTLNPLQLSMIASPTGEGSVSINEAYLESELGQITSELHRMDPPPSIPRDAYSNIETKLQKLYDSLYNEHEIFVSMSELKAELQASLPLFSKFNDEGEQILVYQRTLVDAISTLPTLSALKKFYQDLYQAVTNNPDLPASLEKFITITGDQDQVVSQIEALTQFLTSTRRILLYQLPAP
ncbi:MAG: hypothetical protein LBC25_01235, partial [Holosporales bacterium]|nr:hypothetical protein [Holosporales bacterium]